MRKKPKRQSLMYNWNLYFSPLESLFMALVHARKLTSRRKEKYDLLSFWRESMTVVAWRFLKTMISIFFSKFGLGIKLKSVHDYFFVVVQLAKVSMDTFTCCNRWQKYPWIFWPAKNRQKKQFLFGFFSIWVCVCGCVAVCVYVHDISVRPSLFVCVVINRRTSDKNIEDIQI